MKKQSQEQAGLLQKIAYLFERKQLWQLGGLAVLILIGGILETLGVHDASCGGGGYVAG